MRRLALPALLALGLLCSASAFAAGGKGKVQEFQETEMTDEERAAAQSRRHRVASWQEEKELPQERPFPWMAVGLMGSLLALAAPFAWGAYKRTAQELREADAFGAQPSGPRRTRTKD